MGEDELSEGQFCKRRGGVQMINGDRGEGNLDDDYDVIDGVDIEPHTPIDDIVSNEEEENPRKKLEDPEGPVFEAKKPEQ
jgi:hypothetical protein